MMKIRFPCIKIMFIFSTVEAPIILLNYFCLLIEKFALFIFVFFLFFVHKLATAIKTSKNSLYFDCGSLLVIIFPFNFEHSPVFLDDYSRTVFSISIFFSLIEHFIVRVNDIAMPFLSLFKIDCH